MGKQYRVVAAAAMVTQHTVNGPMKMLRYAGDIIQEGITEAEIAHNVAGGFIREVGGDEPDDGESLDLGPATGTEGNGQAADIGAGSGESGEGGAVGSESDQARADARSKLPADGSAPSKAASTAVWVEYAVAKGYLYDDCVKETRDALITLTNSK
jgi:hypothetical protein